MADSTLQLCNKLKWLHSDKHYWHPVPLTLKPTILYNTDKHVKHTLILNKVCMLCVYYSLWANHISKNIGSWNESLYNKLSFDIKRFIIQRRTHSLQSNEPHIIWSSKLTVA